MPVNDPVSNVDARLRVARILWIAILISIGMLFGFGKYLDGASATRLEGGSPAVLVLYVMCILVVTAGFLMKHRLFSQAREQQKVGLVQSEMILSFALSEASALFGLLLRMAFADRYWYLGFVLAVLSMLLHFPNRDQFLDAMPPSQF